MAAKTTLADNRAKIEQYRPQVAASGVQNLINGVKVPAHSGKTFTTLTPIDNSVICDVAEGDASDIDAAARAAAAARAQRGADVGGRARPARRARPAVGHRGGAAVP